MAVKVPIEYDNVFDFLEDYRAHISQLRYTIPTPEPLATGQAVDIQFTVPLLGDVVCVPGRVMQGFGDRAGVQLSDEGDEGIPRLESFYRFIGQVVGEMLRSGRFKIAGEWGEGAVPAGAMSAPVASANDVTAPLSERVPVGQPTHSGTVSQQGLTEGLIALYRERATGVLEIRSEQGRRLAWLKSGGIVQWENDPIVEEECLGVLLARAGKLTAKQLRESLLMMNETGQRQGECLIEIGVLTFPKLVMSLLTQVEIITRNVFAMEEGTWSFSPAERLPSDLITPPMKTPGFLYALYKRQISALSPDALEERLRPRLDQYTTFATDVNWDDMRLKKDELGLVNILGKQSYRFRSVFSVSNMGRAKTIPVLLALAELDILRFTEAEDVDQVEERWRSQLYEKLSFQTNQNPFEILEIHWTSQGGQVEQGYEKTRTEYQNFARGAELGPEVDKMRNQIVANIEEAYLAVRDKSTRQKTRKKYYEPQQHEFSADLLARQGEMLMVRGKWVEVIDNLERALELTPKSGKIRALLDKAHKKRAGYSAPPITNDL